MEIMHCRLDLTTRAKKEIGNWVTDEYALFSKQDSFAVYIEKLPAKQDNMTFSFYFDPQGNPQLATLLNERVAVLECVYKNEGFLATSFRVKGRKEPVRTNRRLGVRLALAVNRRTGTPMPIQLYTSLRELPIAQERSEYVEKRIASWEGYLRIEEKNADVADVTIQFSNPVLNESFSVLTITCHGLEGKQWRSIQGFSAKINGSNSDIGHVADTNRNKRNVKIELSRKSQLLARQGSLLPKQTGEMTFSNFAELSQIRRLRKGFKDLQDGFAANANLEKVLFEERPVVQITNKKLELDFHHPLNEYQQAAVTGAMSANDLYVIQGPPGTGKTTVISELCHQLMKAGQRTLVASQSNLAVDNALGRLLADPGIRILRYGRTESIEEEGKRFIEENVALHWRDETLAAVNEQREQRADRENVLKLELAQLETQKTQLAAEITVVEQQIANKHEAQKQHRENSQKLKLLKQQQTDLQESLKELRTSQQRLNDDFEQATNKINRLESELESTRILPNERVEMDANEHELLTQRNRIRYFQTVEAIGYAEMEIRRLMEETNEKPSAYDQYPRFLEQLPSIRKLQELEELFEASQLEPSLTATLEMNALRRLRVEIKDGTYPYELLEWREVADRLEKGIRHAETLLRTNQYAIEKVGSKKEDKYKTPEEMHEMLDKIGKFFILPATKTTLAMPQGPEKSRLLDRLAENLAYLNGKASEVAAQSTIIKTASDREAAARFSSLKNEIKEEMELDILQFESKQAAVQSIIDGHQEELRRLKDESDTLAELVDEHTDQVEVETRIVQLEHVKATFDKRVKAAEVLEEAMNVCKEQATGISTQLELVEQSLLVEIDKENVISSDIGVLDGEQEKLLVIVQSEPKKRLEEITKLITVASEKEETIQKEISQLPIAQALQDEWSEMLASASDFDLDEIRKLYVKHANVIGTTCVASARKDFMEEYPSFDVVIIDEVSKATPPELLLPMLKGKKIILVGDHHQLPPLVGRETMEEFIEEIKDPAEKEVLRGMLKESLFERLFRSLPKQNKMMLGIQYRMHEKIMSTIAPFYTEGDYRLQCGLPDSDAARDHLLSSAHIRRDNHLLWFDMPNEPAYFEAQVKGGTSLYNEAELNRISELLTELDCAVDEAKQDGRLGADKKKSVGVISFYGEQVKRIDRLIEQEVMPNHLHCRTGSVDKFQGMEMDIIILSFVRNHDQPSGTIGFAEDYRRLNVALSRARELLIIVGSADMFMKRPKRIATREMYGQLVERVKAQGGFMDLAAISVGGEE
ncbi:DEAD/DEAH box helicase [Sporosarcina quadrami]|nr:AAA domain-containing protein [Sporosarcina quadrami]